MSLLFISEGKLYSFKDEKVSEIKSTLLDSYTEKVKNAAKRNEWKTSGSGAAFTGAAAPGADAQTMVSNIRSKIDCVAVKDGNLIFTQTIDGASGIYSKRKDSSDGIIQSDGEHIYRDFSISGNEILVCAYYAGESHIAHMDLGSPDCEFYTEGYCRDRYPVKSKTNDSIIYYSSAGLMINEDMGDEQMQKPHFLSIEEMVNEVYSAQTTPLGPSSICKLDLEQGSIDEVLSDEKYDYIKPDTDSDGNLYYIKKPYIKPTVKKSGCLLDIILFPFRLIMAIIGFLSIFSLKYSGKTLRENSANPSKSRSDKEMFIDGNIIDADRAYKENRKREGEDAGIIPSNYELCMTDSNGKRTVLQKGVIAYALANGGVYYSNGKSVRFLKNGKSEKVFSFDKITFIYPID